MSISKTTFIVNPQAGGGAVKKRWSDISDLAQNIFGQPSFRFSRFRGDAQNQAAEAIREGAKRIIVVGGDGTVNEVANAFMTMDPSQRHHVVLGIIPIGTGCDFVKSVSISHHPETALRSIKEGAIRRIDAGRASFLNHDQEPVERYFLNIISFGIGGEVARMASRMSTKLSPFVAFLCATFISIFRYGKKQISIKIDENKEKRYRIWNVAVSNGCFHGGGMMVAPAASPDDGLLHTTLIGDLSLAEVLFHLPKLYNGRIYDVKKVDSKTGRRIECASPEHVFLEMDGEPLGVLPVRIDIIPGAIQMNAPAGRIFSNKGVNHDRSKNGKRPHHLSTRPTLRE